MLKKVIVMLLISLLTNVAIFASGNDRSKKEKKFAEKVKTEIAKIGTGTDATVKVKRKKGKKIKGYIIEINEDNFVVMNKKTETTVVIPYSNVKQVKGNNLATGTVVGIALGIAVGIIILILIGKNSS